MREGREDAIARLELRVEQLSRELAEVQAELSQLSTSSAVNPPRQDTDGAVVPAVSASSDPQSKIDLFLSRFIGRRDAYALRWTSSKTGKSGWSPAVRGGFYSKDTSSHDHLPLTPQVIEQHLRHGGSHAGLYVMLPGDICQLLVCDFDDGSWKDDAAAFIAACRNHHIDALAEISRSGEGAHVWIFFDAPQPAATARAMGFRLLREAMSQRPLMKLDSYDRFFPAQDTLSTAARGQARLGNLIALPLNGECRRRGTTVFADPETWEPLPDQFAALAAIELLDSEAVEALAQNEGSSSCGPIFGPKSERVRRPSRSDIKRNRTAAHGTTVKVHVDNVVHLPLAGLPGAVISELKHRSSLPNPEFYRRQAQRYSTFGVPRVVIRYEHDEKELRLPRGLADETQEVLEAAGYTVEIEYPAKLTGEIDVEFHGELRPAQQLAVSIAAEHRAGVLVAPPGTGKTVMACALIAERKVPTAVIVNRRELVTQWRERLSEFLDIPSDRIGQLVSGKQKLSGEIDIIMLQSISRKESDPLILENYAQVVIDECHNIAAPAAEGALNQVSVPYWLGLTATPFRSDKMDEIITMQCGPIRHRMDVDTAVEERYVRIHHTNFTTDVDTGESGAIQNIYNELAADNSRNELITQQVIAAAAEGRNCLVLVNRLHALDALSTLIQEATDVPVLLMHGGQKPQERAELRAQLATMGSADEPYILVAMGKVAGEGFDLPSLNTLFLAAPISFKGVVIQQTGRITRNTGGEETTVIPAIVHDFVDSEVKVLARMHGRRLRAMKKEGFEVTAS